MTTKISIIVPMYKAEAYLHRCLNCNIVQTFTEWKAILVGDGSSDRFGTIYEEYVRSEPRFHIRHKENGEVASACQAGMGNPCHNYRENKKVSIDIPDICAEYLQKLLFLLP